MYITVTFTQPISNSTKDLEHSDRKLHYMNFLKLREEEKTRFSLFFNYIMIQSDEIILEVQQLVS